MQVETGTEKPKKKIRQTPKKPSKAKASKAGKKPKGAAEEVPVERVARRPPRAARQARPAGGNAPEEPPDPEVNLERSFPKVIDALLEKGRKGSHLAAKAAVELIDKVEQRKREGAGSDGKLVRKLLDGLGLDRTKRAVDAKARGAGKSTEGRTRSAV